MILLNMKKMMVKSLLKKYEYLERYDRKYMEYIHLNDQDTFDSDFDNSIDELSNDSNDKSLSSLYYEDSSFLSSSWDSSYEDSFELKE